MADEFIEEWRDKDHEGLFFYQFFERRQVSAILSITQHLECVPSFDCNSNYLVVDAKKRNIFGDVPIKTNNVYFWIGSKSINYERNYALVVECLKCLKGQK